MCVCSDSKEAGGYGDGGLTGREEEAFSSVLPLFYPLGMSNVKLAEKKLTLLLRLICSDP